MIDERKIEFVAAFPAIQGAIRITGDGNGMRIQLDIPEIEMGQAARLILMREKALKVTVEICEPPKSKSIKSNDDYDAHVLDKILQEINVSEGESE